MIVRHILIFIFYFFLTNCGFKAIDQNYLKGFEIVPNIEGEDRIVYLLSNHLRNKSSDKTNKILINAEVTKNKNIKEKNIKNEITKYEINISTLVTYQILHENKSGSYKIDKKGFYSVGDKHSVTLNNEKELIKNLVKQVSEQILNDLRLNLNDL